LEEHKVNLVRVVDGRGARVGALNRHDLCRAKVF
jgi:hypothetical protein